MENLPSIEPNKIDRLGRKTYDQEQRQVLLDHYHSSRLSRLEFCRHIGIAPNTFNGWLSKGKSTQKLSFCELTVEQSLDPQLTLSTPNGYQIDLSSVNLDYITDLLRKLG